MLTAAAVAVGLGDLSPVVFSWMRRSVLAGLLGAADVPVVVFAIIGGRAHDSHEGALVLVTGIILVIGTALYGLGQALQQLLDREPDDQL